MTKFLSIYWCDTCLPEVSNLDCFDQLSQASTAALLLPARRAYLPGAERIENNLALFPSVYIYIYTVRHTRPQDIASISVTFGVAMSFSQLLHNVSRVSNFNRDSFLKLLVINREK